MTDYQRPALTEQEREELQNYLTDCVEHRAMVMSIQDSLRLNILRDKIALAALTATPVTIVPGKMTAVVACAHEYVEGWNACREAMLIQK